MWKLLRNIRAEENFCKALLSPFMSFSPEQCICRMTQRKALPLECKPYTRQHVRHNGCLNPLFEIWGHHASLFGIVAFWSSITFEWLDENSDLAKEIAQLPVHKVIVWRELIREGTSNCERSLATEATRFLFSMQPFMLTELDWALYTGFILGLHFVSLRSRSIWQDAETTELNQENHTSHITRCVCRNSHTESDQKST